MRAEGSNGDVRSYGYGAQDEMLTVREPGRSVENTFDANGRVVLQVATLSDPSFGGVGTYVQTFAYNVEQGRVTETDIAEDGSVTELRFNASGYTDLEIVDATGSHPITVSYNRRRDNVATEVTVRCTANRYPVTRTAATDGDEKGAKEALIRDACMTTARQE